MHSRRRGERGSALILAILILFSMLGLGMLAMRSTTANIEGAGNLRLSKQARYVAELGLYHAVTLMQRETANVMTLREPFVGSHLVVQSDGQVSVMTPGSEDARAQGQWTPPPFLDENRPSTLGPYTGGMVPSYRVRVDGFTPGPPPAGFDATALKESGERFCLMHFTATGYVATTALPTTEALNEDEEVRAAEYTLKAAIMIGPTNARCVAL